MTTFRPDQLLGPLNDVEQKFAPKELYVAGDVSVLHRGGRVAIVGSRKASLVGIARAKKLATILVDHGTVVVSGLADGIDTAAHTTAIAKGGKTIAVIGTPLDRVYPRKNAALQETIAQDHLLVTQFPLGYPTKPGCFPMRNRTMALIADATVIIEASDTSGSLSQGWECLRLGRPLFITKAVSEDPTLTWPAEMQSYGAQILSDETLDLLLESLPPRDSVTVDGPIPF